MELADYRKDFLEAVKVTAANNEDGTVASFVRVAAETLEEAGIIPDHVGSFFTGTGKRGRKLRVDGYALDDFDQTLTLIISEFAGVEGPTLTMTQAKQIFDRLRAFLDESLHGTLYDEVEISTPAYDLVDLLRNPFDRIRKYSFLMVTDRVASEKIEAFEEGAIDGISIEYHIWDMARFYRVFGNNAGKEELDIDLSEYTLDGIPCLEASSVQTAEFRSFLCVLPANVLTDIFDRYGSRLLEGNVRSFLSTKVAVNKAIRSTVLNDPSKFFAFNNGIAATATEVTVEDRSAGRFITSLKGLQIVNGGQTTATLSLTKYKDKVDLSKIYVQMKLTEVDPHIAETMIPLISRSSNSQNKVSEADFFSNHQFHIRMEQLSKIVFAPAVKGAQYETHWFYERTRGQFQQAQSRMTPSEKGKFLLQNPKQQLVTKTDLAKFQNAWRGSPHKVSLGAQKNFIHFANWITDQWGKNDSEFNETFYKESIVLAILFRHVENLVSKQQWYEKGYRANIVAYSVALLSHVINTKCKGLSLNFQEIWNRQSITEGLEQQMVIISKAVFDVLTAEDRGVQNVTEWSKREACWDRVKKLDIPLLKELATSLTDKEEVLSQKSSSKKHQAEFTGMEAQMTVVKLGAEYWKTLFDWAKHKGLISTEETQLLQLACRMSSIRMPNPVQSRKLLDLRNRMHFEGYSDSSVLSG